MAMYRPKYGNKKTTLDGITFDSKKEARRYSELLLQERAGVITNLQLQRRFEIVPKDSMGQALYYVADFVYTENGEMVVEDTKGGKATQTPVYKLKRRLMYKVHGIKIKEI